MKVLTEDGLNRFIEALNHTKSHNMTERTFRGLFVSCSEEVVHGWTKHDVAAEMCRIYRADDPDDGTVEAIEKSTLIDLDIILDKVGKADPSAGIGKWTIDWAIDELYSCEVRPLVERILACY
ncbi:hypothetical protein [Pseudanabaena sp. 'Roaring Creek']|uniref:hypothetical protein n=1 Tax=Pseudanabaena sp. 'Roaring Creek' TaxID=1681830 RepID=UPI0006D7DA13|nr:hypothetical protein [Pseudanabaena sp. 'Roaring Creek']